MNWKLIVLGGIVFYIVMFAISMATGPLVHTGILQESYQATQEFWRPELNQVPPDMAALMPRWITTGVITSLILAAIYGWIRPALGVGWLAGVKYGILLSVLGWVAMASWSGIFNLPNKIWIWWAIEQPFYYLPGGAVLGWLGEKLAPRS
jgi:hypothetical protein